MIDELYREEVADARKASPREKVFGGPQLFDRACMFMLAGLRNEQPDASEEELQQALIARLDLVKRVEDHV